MKNLLLPFILLLCLVSLTSCPKDEACKEGIIGTIHDYTGLSGCQWIIELESGEKLEPVNMHLLDFVPVDKQKVYLKYKSAEKQIGICMVGKRVEITCISVRE